MAEPPNEAAHGPSDARAVRRCVSPVRCRIAGSRCPTAVTEAIATAVVAVKAGAFVSRTTLIGLVIAPEEPQSD